MAAPETPRTLTRRSACGGPSRPSPAARPRLGPRALLASFLFILVMGRAAPLETWRNYMDFTVRVAVVQDARHIAFGVTQPYGVTDLQGAPIAGLMAQRLYFADLDDAGRIVLRDASGHQVARETPSIRMDAGDNAGAAIYIEAIRDVDSWRSSRLKEAPSYRGAIRIAIGDRGLLVAVNELPLEHYLLGVVGPEIGGFAPPEALKAQAVAARSEAYAKLRRQREKRNPIYDFTSSSPQVYRGWREENLEVRKAIDETRGLVLTWHGQPVDAVYGHSCGGVVAEIQEIWGGAPLAYSRKRWDREGLPASPDLRTWDAAHSITRTDGIDAWCSPHQDEFPRYAEKHFRWRRSYSADDLTRFIDPVYNTGRIQHIEVERRSQSGRVQRLRIEGEERAVTLQRELHIRGALGNLKSTFFTFTTDTDAAGNLERLHLYGAGYGHGAGMCQMGAFMMAKNGYDYRQILAHYYSGVALDRLYP